MIAAGFGLRRAATAEDLTILFARACALAGVGADAVACLATIEERACLPAFQQAAERLGISTRSVARSELAAVGDRIATRSERVQALYGVGSVAEAAALVAAGDGASLLLNRISTDRATCALAESKP